MGFQIPEYGDWAGGDPQILLKIEGQVIGEELDLRKIVQSFSFKESVTHKDVMELTLWDEEMYYSGHPLFQTGNIISARWGYRGNLSKVFNCRIMDIECSYPQRGKPLIQLRALDQSCDMGVIPQSFAWKAADPNPYIDRPGIAFSEIAEALADMYGFGKVIYPSFDMSWPGHHERFSRVDQINESDLVFLTRLAKIARWGPEPGQIGFDFYIEGSGPGQGSTLHFHPSWYVDPEEDDYELEYYSDPREGSLLSFDIRLNAESAKGAASGVVLRELDPRQATREVWEHWEDKLIREVVADNKTTEAKEIHGDRTALPQPFRWFQKPGFWTVRERRMGSIRGGVSHNAPEPWGDKAEVVEQKAKDEAQAAYVEDLDKECEATALTIGIPRLRAKRYVNIIGIPYKYTGVYKVIECIHQVIPGYRCELHLTRRGQRAIEGEDNMTKLEGRSYIAPPVPYPNPPEPPIDI